MNYIAPPRSEGTIQHTRKKQPWPKDRLFRILSIDGGGIRGVFPAAYLAEIEKRFLGGGSIAHHFDMIAGTSTGGIIALGLASGMTAAQVLQIYSERGEIIFPSPRGLGRVRQLIRFLFRPKHDQSVLKAELLRIFGDKVINEASTRLVVPSFEGAHGEPFIYKTPHHPDYKKDRHKTLTHVGLHTSAAPAYYPAVEADGLIMIDGGVWANNPIMNALVDVLACYDIPRENIRILSIGTGEEALKLKDKQLNGGVNGWGISLGVSPLFKIAAKAQSKNALGQAYLLVGKNNVIRVDVPEHDQLIALDDFRRSLIDLPRAARAQADASGHYIESVFLADKVDPFTPCPIT
ncbi:CBASS cGAMP-activated phospholipase [Rhizobium leguminosarum]|uniref:CBASS cGAMP-activated phospholipase n=1 Tax=Rhizobium leguminosarum TaxID=384 RepID=UPI001040AEE0|nr:CBASS cGAMP-activated phospholipase [Rhizobium leguminosarum]TCA66479.1 patatin [Rhizobium leguminosarum bv. viciae]TCB30403.1 patatin [Rhizobium leguminosarum bv. viciae]